LDPSKTAYDDVSHGTHVAGIIASNVGGIELIALKIVDRNGGRLSQVIKAFDEAIDRKVNIINTSFGLLSPSFALESLVNEASADNIFIVSAAGNNSSSGGFYPASYANTIAVAGVDERGDKMTKSNYGPWIDFAANGQFIYSSLPGDQYGVKSGTSQSAPLVSARVASILQEYGMEISLDELKRRLWVDGTLIGGGQLSGVMIVH
jgi:subtilisin family serine protease